MFVRRGSVGVVCNPKTLFEAEVMLVRFFFELNALIIRHLPAAVKADCMQQSPYLV